MLAVTVRTAVDVTAIFYLCTHLQPDLQQEKTYTASAAVTCVWKRQWIECLGKGPLPSIRRSWRDWWLGSYLSTLYSMVLQTNRGAEAPETEGAASHMGLEDESTNGEGTSGTEGEGSTTTETGGDTTDSDTSSDGSSLAVADTSVATPTTGVRGSTEAPVSPASVPAPPAKAKKGPPPNKVKKGTPDSKGKEAPPASKGKKKTTAGRSKEAPPSAKGRKGHTTPAMPLQLSDAAGEGLEVTTTTGSTATCTAASTATCTAAATATCTAGSSTTASSSSPRGQPSKAAGEGLEATTTTVSTTTCSTTGIH
ncbi:hypothetical protein NDU88_006164 [Pleurodeles waltl]|uniref:Uncharacterized protein n=1 Tax=Pleurodeles waltl TaxID=8319 RepID=A0AAV7N030_PLEWA|nr:hypothetical protein NDU88_006164 [Pleurodeles waltl]